MTANPIILACTALAFAAVGPAVAAPSLTIYNDEFAVVRETLNLDLKKGVNEVRFAEMTAHLDPTSVMLRDSKGKTRLEVLEQNYRGDTASQNLLLSLNEGKEIDFLVREPVSGAERIVRGKVIRSGYVPHPAGMNRFGQAYMMRQYAMSGQGSAPLVEVDGKVRFVLPGTPLFDGIGDAAVLKPTVEWLIDAERAGRVQAELAYLTGGMAWNADYNIVAPEEGAAVDLTGWVTLDNQSGKSFLDAKIKLMAGDVNRVLTPQEQQMRASREVSRLSVVGAKPHQVSEKSFDEYHLYALSRKVTLRDRETKQVELIRASGIKTKRRYVYDGLQVPQAYRSWNMESIRNQQDYGTQSNPKVWVMRELMNSKANGLGIPLPKGKVRFFLKDDDGQLEMTGENLIGHTPKDELWRVYTGNAFDLVGERKRTHFYQNHSERLIQEKFEIVVRNHKKRAATVTIVEHLYRWYNWEISQNSHPFEKKDSQMVEFSVEVPADGEAKAAYSVSYTW